MLCRCAILFALLLLLSCSPSAPNGQAEYPVYLYLYHDDINVHDSLLVYHTQDAHLLAEKTFDIHKAKDSIEYIQAGGLCFKMLKLQHQKFGVVVYADSVINIYRASNDGFHFVSTVACHMSAVTCIAAKDVNGDGNKDLVIADREGAHGNEYTEIFLFDPASQNLRYLRTANDVNLENMERDSRPGYLRSKHYSSAQGSNVKTIYKIVHDSLVHYQSICIHPLYTGNRFILSKTEGRMKTQDTLTAEHAWKIFNASYWNTQGNW